MEGTVSGLPLFAVAVAAALAGARAAAVAAPPPLAARGRLMAMFGWVADSGKPLWPGGCSTEEATSWMVGGGLRETARDAVPVLGPVTWGDRPGGASGEELTSVRRLGFCGVDDRVEDAVQLTERVRWPD